MPKHINDAEAIDSASKRVRTEAENADAILESTAIQLKDSATLAALGHLKYQQANNYDALRLLSLAIDYDQYNAFAFSTRAKTYLKEGNFDAALADANQALSLNYREVDAYAVRTNVYYNRNQLDSALFNANEALKLKPNHFSALEMRCRIYIKQNNSLAIEKDLHDYSAQCAPNSFTHYAQANIDYARRNFISALDHINQSIAMGPNKIEPINLRISIHTALGNVDAALADHQELIKRHPNHQGFRLERAKFYIKQKNGDAALQDLEACLKIDFSYLPALNERLALYIELGHFDKAFKDINTLIRFKPDDIDTLKRRSELHEKKGDAQAAIADLRKALDLQSSSTKNAPTVRVSPKIPAPMPKKTMPPLTTPGAPALSTSKKRPTPTQPRQQPRFPWPQPTRNTPTVNLPGPRARDLDDLTMELDPGVTPATPTKMTHSVMVMYSPSVTPAIPSPHPTLPPQNKRAIEHDADVSLNSFSADAEREVRTPSPKR